MRSALDLARDALLLSNPNPRVGCVLSEASGKVIGSGHTQQAGGPHAEVMALRHARMEGFNTRGCTAFVTLEPCSHHGRTPPCCDALIEAGVARVVIATLDPNPLVAGKGVERLRATGMDVEVLPADSPEAVQARELNIGFFSRMVRGTPWVRLKSAMSLDGTTALNNGASQWITGEAARTDGHAWRARACAVLTGIGTVREDDPMLDVRLVETPRQPHLVIVDSRLETLPTARLFGKTTPQRRIFIYCAVDNAERRAALEARGAVVVHMPGTPTTTESKVDLAAMLSDLGRREVNELHVEAGHGLHGSLIREGLVDEFLVYLAPQLLGPGKGMANLAPLSQLQDGVQLAFGPVSQVGNDLRIPARVAGRDAFLRA
ncbi:bifunctional diaminohydroxyphosphoribosylaminopyrimidine deaminase/5-amino-6-(5-phosphoribosylamino)uracil reductase RibD [Hydrogenophaga crassostreae]|uniref:bifunctional diaminohydroxyphosphoribosylaminopyrimidine deaminase/5-amino-6-(5-phosphoribosylamino)uracil reductase RibD n=1 Tax=Hydrogenophaga crassostreae TaxID=1763535 RepID=UPI000BBA4020|nr:bifunctional diaminohydroxyphosphoribosylaminopyrimidine deaminase/5-amino-6-(5-phosphoribosylamino)uracil reductase RibD [Hydrogenophaga crassostreae]